MENENGKNYAFVKQPKKLSLLLNAGERSLYGILLDYQTMSKNEGFKMSYSYVCKNLKITDKTAQKLVRRLIELDLIEKISGYNNRSKNFYKVKLEKIYEFDKMSNDEIFEYRDKLNSKKSIKEVSKKSNDVELNHNNDIQLQPETLTADPAEPADPVNLSEEEEEHVTQDLEDYFEAKIKGVPTIDKIKNLKTRYNQQEHKIIRKYVQSERFSSPGIRKFILEAIA